MSTLRPFQKEALQALSDPSIRHVVCISPTGSGKTRIIEEWVRRTKKKTLFLSPLVALNSQQKKRFEVLGLDSWIEVRTPESLESTKSGFRVQDYDHAVVDECHTIYEWGETFRPALRRVPALIAPLKTLLLTATLPQRYEYQLRKELISPLKTIGQFSFNEKVTIQTLQVTWSERLDFIHQCSGLLGRVGVIFCNSRNWCERIQRYLQSRGLSASFYHAGLSREERLIIENKMRSGQTSVLVSTVAFGLGMHVPQIKWGMSWGFPGSFLTLAQMMGRVGRSSEGGRFYFLWSWEDELVWKRKYDKTPSSQYEFNALQLGMKSGLSIQKIIESELRSSQTQ